MKQMLAALAMIAAAFIAAPTHAETPNEAAAEWKGQVKTDYVRSDSAFHVVATDDEAWTRAWRFKLDEKPPRPLRTGETGVLLIGDPRPTPGYTVGYSVIADSGDALVLEAWVESPEMTLFPAGSSSHPWRALVLESEVSNVDVSWRE
jgi:hypothetical protein